MGPEVGSLLGGTHPEPPPPPKISKHLILIFIPPAALYQPSLVQSKQLNTLIECVQLQFKNQYLDAISVKIP